MAFCFSLTLSYNIWSFLLHIFKTSAILSSVTIKSSSFFSSFLIAVSVLSSPSVSLDSPSGIFYYYVCIYFIYFLRKKYYKLINNYFIIMIIKVIIIDNK